MMINSQYSRKYATLLHSACELIKKISKRDLFCFHNEKRYRNVTSLIEYNFIDEYH